MSQRFTEIEVGIDPMRTQGISEYLQAQWKQYGLKDWVASPIHSAMGDTLNKVAMQLTGSIYELWDRAQVVVALTRIK